MRKKAKKLTAEEKKAARAAKKEQKSKAAEELQIHRRNAELQREIQYGAEAVRRHEKKWRAMLQRIAVPHIRNELECTWHVFESIIDTKDFTISLLLDELKQADDQYETKVKAQVDNIDRLITLYFDQINELWEESRKVIMALYQAATFERNAVQEITKDHENYLKTMLYGQDEQRKESIKISRGAYLAQVEMENSKMGDDTARFVIQMREVWDKMYDEAQKFIQEYTIATAQRKQEYEELDARDVEVSDAIRRSWHQIEQRYYKIKTLTTQLHTYETGRNRPLEDLINEADYYEKELRQEQAVQKEQRKQDNEILTLLTLQSTDVIEKLAALEKKGRKVLTLTSVCRKLETPEEKTLQFPVFGEQQVTRPSADLSVSSDEEEENEGGGTLVKDLEMFWNRVAGVEVSRYKLQEKCDLLRQENAMLKTQIFKYCECLSCEPQVQFLYDNSELFQKYAKP